MHAAMVYKKVTTVVINKVVDGLRFDHCAKSDMSNLVLFDG